MTAIIAFLVVFSAAVIVHELGHFLAARAMSVKAYEFSIGFPFSPRIATLFRHRETEFTVRLLPLGGFVSFSREGDGEDFAFLSVKRWRRAVIAAAGPAFNFIFAFIVLVPAYALWKETGLSGGAHAALAQINNGIASFYNLIYSLFTGGGSIGSISGPVGIAVMAGKAMSAGAFDLLFFTAILSLSLGLFNLLPLPALDGGQLLVLGIESLLWKPLGIKAYGAIGAAGIAFFVLLTVVVTYRDILRIIT